MANYVSALTGSAMDDALQQMNNRVPEGWAVGERDGVPVGEESLYYHNNAKYYAEQAQAQAESAEESAESASQVAQETADAVIAQAFVQESAEVGSIVTIDDGADNIPLKDLKVNLAINQPLHGQANPYPAGGGKNLFQTTSVSGSKYGVNYTVNNDGSVKVSGTNTSASNSNFYMGTVVLPAGTYVFSGVTGGEESTYRIRVIRTGGATIKYVQEPETITFSEETSVDMLIYIGAGYSPNLTVYPMICLSTATDPTVFAPYSNICPIYPVTEAEVNVNNGNHWDEEWELGYYSTTTGLPGSSTTGIRCKNPILIKTGASYRFVKPVGTGSVVILYYTNSDTYISYEQLGASLSSKVLTIPEGAAIIRFYLSATYGTTYNNDISINHPDTDTSYHAYTGQQYLVNVGINRWDEEWELGAIDQGTGENVSASNQIRAKNNIAVIPNTDYYIKSPYVTGLRFYGADGTYKGYLNNKQNSIATIPADAYFMRFVAVSTTSSADISVNYPARFTDYYPYTGNVVYGGELDVTTGVLTARYKSVTWNGTENWGVTASGNYYRFQLSVSDIKSVGPSTTAAIVADKLATTIANEPYTVKQYNQLAWVIMPNTISTAEQFKAWLAENPIQAVYPLATPISIQLDPTAVNTLRGDNVIFCDAGDITNCEYRADLKMYIDKVVG